VDAKSARAAFAGGDETPTLLIDGGAAPLGQASTVIDLTTPELRLVREGAIGFDAVRAALGAA
jgi:tRNA A37 threonylcarbamoyladenosine synthetase subunit TsaC/SUA5/YrdC